MYKSNINVLQSEILTDYPMVGDRKCIDVLVLIAIYMILFCGNFNFFYLFFDLLHEYCQLNFEITILGIAFQENLSTTKSQKGNILGAIDSE